VRFHSVPDYERQHDTGGYGIDQPLSILITASPDWAVSTDVAAITIEASTIIPLLECGSLGYVPRVQ
jgi:hypothetical protein